ncbi:MAG: formate dehydrogenase subunit gamma [Burkholderiaceae bacterium]|nr:formate dehydrogenase subunit gamma [Burkholderiaceae bacterium]
MSRAIRMLALLLGLWGVVAVVHAQGAPAGGPQPANILEATRDDQAARQKVQPLNNAPVWREVNSPTAGFTNLPANEGGVLIQSAGEEWRLMRNGPITRYGGWGLVVVLLLIAAFYLFRGQIKVQGQPTGRLIERFTVVERSVHWLNAACFVVLGLTGIIMLFGKYLLLPVFGYTLFSILATMSKTGHNFIGPLFAVTLIAMFLTYVKDNFPRAYDLTWLVKGGGLLSRNVHVPSHRFNGGEKMLFWGGLVLLGTIVAVTGFILDFPNYGQTRAQMQDAWMIHAIAALLFIALIMGHIYIGTIGTEGALDAMKTGYVDEAWAKEHHEYWYDDVKAGKIPAQRSGRGAARAAGSAAQAQG